MTVIWRGRDWENLVMAGFATGVLFLGMLGWWLFVFTEWFRDVLASLMIATMLVGITTLLWPRRVKPSEPEAGGKA